MPGNYRYEEERSRGRRGMTRRGGTGWRGRDDEESNRQENERYDAGPGYGSEWSGTGESRYQGESGGSWRASGGREYGRSLGGREYEEYDEGEHDRSPYAGEGREERYGASERHGTGARYGARDRYEAQERFSQDRYGTGERHGGYGEGDRDQGSWRGGRAWQEGRERGSMQADGWTPEPDEMRWGRRQGLYGSSEYGGYLSSQRSQADYQSHVGKGPKGWQRSDERIREEVNEALARHAEIDASDLEVQVQNGEVTLTGTVTDRRAKRLAEDVAEGVFGARDVTNQIKVNKNQFADRDVTGSANREGRTGTDQETQSSRKAGTSATARGTTTR